MYKSKDGPRYTRPRTRNLKHRTAVLDPLMDLERRLHRGSFLPVVARVLRRLANGDMVAGKFLAEACKCTCRVGAVWGHLGYLADKKVLVRTYDGARTYFSFSRQMDTETQRVYAIIYARVAEYWNYFAARGPRRR